MDLLAEIRQRLAGISADERVKGIESAVRHIEVAERYLTRGRQDQDGDVFNDVIYRTNQAFEGMLKEAYAAIEDANATRLSPHEIEQYFSKKKRLTDRVRTLFSNYRQNWRNPATHDHTLLFSEQEALLAIVTVSAFALLLLDQIVETISFKRQRAETEERWPRVAEDLRSMQSMPLVEQVVSLLQRFMREARGEAAEIASEAELLGRISGFLVGVYPELDVSVDSRVGDHYRVDLLLRSGGEVIVVEVKRARPRPQLIHAIVRHMRSYLEAAKTKAGILLLWAPEGRSDDSVRRLPSGDGTEIWVVGAPVGKSGGLGSARRDRDPRDR